MNFFSQLFGRSPWSYSLPLPWTFCRWVYQCSLLGELEEYTVMVNEVRNFVIELQSRLTVLLVNILNYLRLKDLVCFLVWWSRLIEFFNCPTALDISSDLTELGKTPVAVICAGVKSILDIPRTLEYLVGAHFYFLGLMTQCKLVCNIDWPVACVNKAGKFCFLLTSFLNTCVDDIKIFIFLNQESK